MKKAKTRTKNSGKEEARVKKRERWEKKKRREEEQKEGGIGREGKKIDVKV